MISCTHLKNFLFRHKSKVTDANVKQTFGESVDLKYFFALNTDEYPMKRCFGSELVDASSRNNI